jgi:outer membrane protein assembly factor BamE (lipoprotein component of BamABCDE complex)
VRNLEFFAYALLVATTLTDCTAAQHQRSLGSTAEREMTVGTVQKEIRVGLSQADVAEALGSPNIVTKDATGKETWIYDKIASEASYSASSAYGNILILGMASASGAASSTQKTLTVIIKFDPNNKVDSFTYHTSKF